MLHESAHDVKPRDNQIIRQNRGLQRNEIPFSFEVKQVERKNSTVKRCLKKLKMLDLRLFKKRCEEIFRTIIRRL